MTPQPITGPDLVPCESCGTVGYLDDSADREPAGTHCIECPACLGEGEVLARCVECDDVVVNLVCTRCGCGDENP